MTPFLEKWNPTVKAATVLVCVILLSVQYLVSLNLTVFALCLVLLLAGSRCGLRRLAALLLPAGVAALGLFFLFQGHRIPSLLAFDSSILNGTRPNCNTPGPCGGGGFLL